MYLTLKLTIQPDAQPITRPAAFPLDTNPAQVLVDSDGEPVAYRHESGDWYAAADVVSAMPVAGAMFRHGYPERMLRGPRSTALNVRAWDALTEQGLVASCFADGWHRVVAVTRIPGTDDVQYGPILTTGMSRDDAERYARGWEPLALAAPFSSSANL